MNYQDEMVRLFFLQKEALRSESVKNLFSKIKHFLLIPLKPKQTRPGHKITPCTIVIKRIILVTCGIIAHDWHKKHQVLALVS